MYQDVTLYQVRSKTELQWINNDFQPLIYMVYYDSESNCQNDTCEICRHMKLPVSAVDGQLTAVVLDTRICTDKRTLCLLTTLTVFFYHHCSQLLYKCLDFERADAMHSHTSRYGRLADGKIGSIS